MAKRKVVPRRTQPPRRSAANPTSPLARAAYTFPQPADSGLQAQKYHRQSPAQPRQPLPAPTGLKPYELRLEQILGDSAVAGILPKGQMTLFSGRDTRGMKFPFSQHAGEHGL